MGLDAIECARPDGAARETGVVCPTDTQRRGMVMAKKSAAKGTAKKIETSERTGAERDCIVTAELIAKGVRLNEAQRRALVARVARRAELFQLTEEAALAAVAEARSVLLRIGWTYEKLALVMMFEGRVVGAHVLGAVNAWTGVALRVGVLTAVVSSECGDRIAVFEHIDGTREAKVLPLLLGGAVLRAVERDRERGVFDVFDAHTNEAVELGVGEADARVLVSDF